MLIVCPNCATSYAVADLSLGPAGRAVRCARCRTQWFAAPTQSSPVSAFVNDVIAEAEARTAPAPQPPQQDTHPMAPDPARESPPAAPQASPPQLPADDIAQFTAALNEISSVQPMAPDDVAPADQFPSIEPPTLAGESPPIVPPPEPERHPEPDHDDIEHFAARHAQRLATQRKRKRATQIPALAVALVMIAGAILFWRNDLVRHLPQTASLFSAIGLPVNVRGIVFEEVAVSKESHDGVTVLVIEGKIVSTSSKPADVPRLRFAVRNASGTEIYSWTAQPPRSILGAGESVPFRSRLASPPAGANDVLVRFFTPHDIASGGK